MQSELAGLFDPLIDAGARFLLTCVVAGAASLTARVLHSRAKKRSYPAMPERSVRLWTLAYDTVIWGSAIAVVLMFLLFLQTFDW